MSEIILLSDSDEYHSSAENDSDKNTDLAKKAKRDTSPFRKFSNLESTPSTVYSNYVAERNRIYSSQDSHNDRIIHDSDYTTKQFCIQSPLHGNLLNRDHNKYNSKDANSSNAAAHSISSSDESESDILENVIEPKLTNMDTNLQMPTNCARNSNREKVVAQKKIKQAKTLKTMTSKASKVIKREEYINFVEVVIDSHISKLPYYTEIINSLKFAHIRYSIDTQLIPYSISWKRILDRNRIDINDESCAINDTQMENHTMIIWSYDEVVEKVRNHSFFKSISDIKSQIPKQGMTLVIFGKQSHLSKDERRKRIQDEEYRATSDQKERASSCQKLLNMSQKQIQVYLTEIQITGKCNSRFVDSIEELSQMIHQYTKAIAEKPYKLQKYQQLQNRFDWYVIGDNKGTIRIDKDGNGLKRLWQQQLRQFNLCSLETADAISRMYSGPLALVQAYQRCTVDDGINLLRDIHIRRAAGPLTTARKVGPELSKKIYLTFTSKDADTVL